MKKYKFNIFMWIVFILVHVIMYYLGGSFLIVNWRDAISNSLFPLFVITYLFAWFITIRDGITVIRNEI